MLYEVCGVYPLLPCPPLLQPKAGFGAHPHTNAEIFSYIVQAGSCRMSCSRSSMHSLA